MWGHRKWYHACLAPQLAVCAVNVQWRAFHFIIRETRPRVPRALIHTSAIMGRTRGFLFTPRRGHSWHQIGECAKKSQTRHNWHRSGHQILPHALMPPSETYIYLFITATHAPPPPTLEVIWKLETCEHPPSVVTYGGSDCGNYLCHLLWTYSIWVSGPQWKELKEGDLGDGGGDPDGRAAARSIEHDAFSPTSACKQMWFSLVIWFISVMWIPFDKKYHQ